MPTNKLLEVQKGFGRAHTKKSDILGPLVAELQDHVEDLDSALGTGGATVAANILTIAQSCVIALPVSFETGEQLTHTLYFPKGATVSRLRALVTKALANTDAGTIQGKNDGGTNMTTGLITIPLSSALATEVTVTPTGNNTFTAGQKAQFAVAKTTVGGKATLFVEFTVPTA
jgi:hypothetical protein